MIYHGHAHAAPSDGWGTARTLWRWEWIGALTFSLAAALILIASLFPHPTFALSNLLLFVLPMALISALFWIDWKWRNEIRPALTR